MEEFSQNTSCSKFRIIRGMCAFARRRKRNVWQPISCHASQLSQKVFRKTFETEDREQRLQRLPGPVQRVRYSKHLII